MIQSSLAQASRRQSGVLNLIGRHEPKICFHILAEADD
jgi:hypothetical protein